MNSIISILTGALIAVMIMLNGTLSGNFGNYTSTVIIHVVGLLAMTAVLFISKSKLSIQKGIPWYFYSAGVIGVFTVLFSNFSFSVLGVSIPLALGLFGQSASSILIDHFGLFGMKKIAFEKKKFIGLLIIISGIFVMAVY